MHASTILSEYQVFIEYLVICCLGDASHINSYCRHQQGINIKETITFIHLMCETTPTKYFAACPQHPLAVVERDSVDRRKRGTVLAPQYQDDNTAAAQENMALHAGNPVFPIPVGENRV